MYLKKRKGRDIAVTKNSPEWHLGGVLCACVCHLLLMFIKPLAEKVANQIYSYSRSYGHKKCEKV